MEQEFIQNQEIHRPREEQNDVCHHLCFILSFSIMFGTLHRANERKLMIYGALP